MVDGSEDNFTSFFSSSDIVNTISPQGLRSILPLILESPIAFAVKSTLASIKGIFRGQGRIQQSVDLDKSLNFVGVQVERILNKFDYFKRKKTVRLYKKIKFKPLALLRKTASALLNSQCKAMNELETKEKLTTSL